MASGSLNLINCPLSSSSWVICEQSLTPRMADSSMKLSLRGFQNCLPFLLLQPLLPSVFSSVPPCLLTSSWWSTQTFAFPSVCVTTLLVVSFLCQLCQPLYPQPRLLPWILESSVQLPTWHLLRWSDDISKSAYSQGNSWSTPKPGTPLSESQTAPFSSFQNRKLSHPWFLSSSMHYIKTSAHPFDSSFSKIPRIQPLCSLPFLSLLSPFLALLFCSALNSL